MGSYWDYYAKKEEVKTIEEIIIDYKLAAKMILIESKKSKQRSKIDMKKAKQELKKNNEEGAKLFLVTAAESEKESLNLQRMANKVEFMTRNLRSVESNQKIMKLFNNAAGNIANLESMNFETMAKNIETLEKSMEQTLLFTKVTEEIMSTDISVDKKAEEMFKALKTEIQMETENEINEAMDKENEQFYPDISML